MVLKKEKSKKLKKPPAKKLNKRRLGGLVVLDGRRQIDRRTGMNRDIPPMGGAGGSPNLIAALAARPPISAQTGYVIQTPDQFKQAQDISNIAEAVKKTIKIGEVTTLGDVEELKKIPVKTLPKGSMSREYYGSQPKITPMNRNKNNLREKLVAEKEEGGMAKSAGGAAKEPPAPMVQQPASLTEPPIPPKPRGRPRKATGQAAMIQSPDILQPPEWYGGGNAAETAPLDAVNFEDPYESSLAGRQPI